MHDNVAPNTPRYGNIEVHTARGTHNIGPLAAALPIPPSGVQAQTPPWRAQMNGPSSAQMSPLEWSLMGLKWDLLLFALLDITPFVSDMYCSFVALMT